MSEIPLLGRDHEALQQFETCRLVLDEDLGAAPTVGDLAKALDVSKPTVRRDLAALHRAGHRVQTRGSRRR